MKKKAILAALLLSVAAFATGCVPEEEATTVQINPDFNKKDNIQLDFNQLHNDTLEGLQDIEDGEPFVFISDVDVSGNNDSKTITVRAKAVDGATEDDCVNFAAALLTQINDAAVNQDTSIEASSTTSFGSLFNKYTIDLAVENETDGGFIYTLNVPAGEDIGLNPDYEQYIEDWKRDLEIYKSNLVYDVNGKVVKDGNE